jgi:hypothetical protein
LIPIFVGFDQREAVAYHAFCQSVIATASQPVSFVPLSLKNLESIYEEEHLDGSNAFIYSRFLVPYLMGYKGWAIFADGDMICRTDIAELWGLRDQHCAVMVAKHDYKTKFSRKYLGAKNEDYPKKNWSSLILWNCGHPANLVLSPFTVAKQPGSYLHRFEWLNEFDVGEIPLEWNWLAMEYEDNDTADLVHYTIGTPCFSDYQNCDMSAYWWQNFNKLNEGMNK